MDINPAASSDDCGLEPFEVEIHRVCGILGSIAKGFSPESEEGLAIRDAALAFQVVQIHRTMKERYKEFRAACDGELTDEMQAEMHAKLRSIGIDPDKLEDDESDE